MVARVIPSYALYGEQAVPSWQHSFDFEWIPQRSVPYNWLIRPHKHDAFVQLLYLTHGGGTVLMDDAQRVMKAPCLVSIPAQTVHGFHFQPDVDGPVITAAQRPLESMLSTTMRELLPVVRKPMLIPLDGVEGHHEQLMPLFLAIEQEAKMQAVGQVSAVMSLLTAIYVRMARLSQHRDAVTPAPASSRKTAQIERFRSMVETSFTQHLPMAVYAGKLGITAGQLSRLCREVLGMSSLDVVNARLVHEAQRELIYTGNSVKQLADILGFNDEAYFGRFFRKHTGLTPREFRAKALSAMEDADAPLE